MPHNPLAAILQSFIGKTGNKRISFGFQGLCQHAACAFPRQFGQWVCDRIRLAKWQDVYIVLHGVLLLVRFWLAFTPPQYAAFQITPSPKLPHSSSYDPSKPSCTRSACICLAVRRSLRDLRCSIASQPDSFSANGSNLLGRTGVWNRGSTMPARRYLLIVLRDSPVRREIS